MQHGPLIADKIAQSLRRSGHDCTQDHCSLVLPNWSLRIDVQEGETNEGPNGTIILPSVIALHRYLPKGFARELGVGCGNSLQQAIDSVVVSWLVFFFPLMKFLFEEQPHDCTVHQERLSLRTASGQEYSLLAGPLQFMGFETAPKNADQLMLWNSLSSQFTSLTKWGVHHVRCYTCRTANQCQADAFLDGVEWPESSALLLQIASEFPEPDSAHPIYAFKQHFLLRPENLAADAEEGARYRISEWATALANRNNSDQSPFMEPILQALVEIANPGTEQEHEKVLVQKGVAPSFAGGLVAFLPSAAARLFLSDKYRFSETYFWTNKATRKAIERRYDGTPLFMASLEALQVLHQLGLAKHELMAVAGSSAEMSGARKAAAAGELSGGSFSLMIHYTDEPVQGENLDVLLARQRKPRPPAQCKRPWWKPW